MSYRMQPADVQAKWREYRHRCDSNIATVRYRDRLVQVPKPIIYSLEGFCLFLDLSEDDLTKYENNKNYKAIFKKIRYQVMCRKMAALVNGEGNARALIFDLKVNHGIDPKQAREETDWKITLNLNHDNEEVLFVRREDENESRQAGLPRREDDSEEESEELEEESESPEDEMPKRRDGGGEESGENLGETVVTNRPSVSEEVKSGGDPAANSSPPSPPTVTMGVYSIW